MSSNSFLFSEPWRFAGKFNLYVLEHVKTNRIYVGIAQNLLKRLAKHFEAREPGWDLRALYMMRRYYYEANKIELWVQKHARQEELGLGPRINNAWLREQIPVEEILKSPDNREQAFMRAFLKSRKRNDLVA
jgi:predicted GIY-YIG superfamily endonuclease